MPTAAAVAAAAATAKIQAMDAVASNAIVSVFCSYTYFLLSAYELLPFLQLRLVN